MVNTAILAKLADWHGACFLKLVNYQKKAINIQYREKTM